MQNARCRRRTPREGPDAADQTPGQTKSGAWRAAIAVRTTFGLIGDCRGNLSPPPHLNPQTVYQIRTQTLMRLFKRSVNEIRHRDGCKKEDGTSNYKPSRLSTSHERLLGFSWIRRQLGHGRPLPFPRSETFQLNDKATGGPLPSAKAKGRKEGL